jgi:hypothetical protein
MRINRLVLLLLASGLALLGLSLGATASADPAYPPSTGCTVSTSDRSVAAGDTVTVSGSGFPASTSVGLTMQSGQSLGSVNTDSHGGFSTQVTIPANAAPHDRIVAMSSSTTCSFDPNTATPPAPPQTPGSQTATTGFAAITATVIAVALLAGGVLFVALGRRRRV